MDRSPSAVPLEGRVDRLWRGFATVGRVPRREIREVLHDWDTLAPVFLARLQAYVENPESRAEDADSLLVAIHLFAQMRDTRAYRPLIALVSRPREETEDLLGDAVTGTLSKVVASVFDGDPVPMQETILDPAVDEFVAHALFEALAFLTAEERIPLGITRLFIERCRAQQPRDEPAGMRWAGWQKMVSYLGLTEYVPHVREAFRRGEIDPGYMGVEDFKRDLAASLNARGRGEPPSDPELGYFEDAIEEFTHWYGFSPRCLRDRERAEREKRIRELQAARNRLSPAWRQTGRNDPCPCGSGHKYKKCCLGKEPAAMAGPV